MRSNFVAIRGREPVTPHHQLNASQQYISEIA
ncbi:hypothetical protein A2U01_0075918, partial [Trifolium medium]|nr:hypothetical protein [Trifolium medium]